MNSFEIEEMEWLWKVKSLLMRLFDKEREVKRKGIEKISKGSLELRVYDERSGSMEIDKRKEFVYRCIRINIDNLDEMKYWVGIKNGICYEESLLNVGSYYDGGERKDVGLNWEMFSFDKRFGNVVVELDCVGWFLKGKDGEWKEIER